MTLPPCGKVPGLEALKDAKAAINAKLNLGKSALADLNSKLTAFKADVLAAVPKIPSLVSFQTELAGLIGASSSTIATFRAKWQGKVPDLNNLVAKVTGGIAGIASLDFCKDIPNIKMDSSGNVTTEPPESKPVTEKPKEPEKITPTVVDNSTKISTGRSGLSNYDVLTNYSKYLDAVKKEIHNPTKALVKAAIKSANDENKNKKFKNILSRAAKHNKTVAQCVAAGIEFNNEEIAYAKSVKKLIVDSRDIDFAQMKLTSYLFNYERTIKKTFGDANAELDYAEKNNDWSDNKTEIGARAEKFGFKSYYQKSISIIASYRTAIIDYAYYDQNASK